MFSKRLAAWLLILDLAALGHAQVSGSPDCHEPEYFGLCNPYVPGVMTGKQRANGVPVLDVWPRGPAEEAGICPGDHIISVNGRSTRAATDEAILKLIVSGSPTPVTFQVNRNGKEFQVTVRRVRESTLATLSGRAFLNGQAYPFRQTLSGLDSIDLFLQRVGRRFGLRHFRGLWFPDDLSDEQIQHILQLVKGLRQSGRIASVIPAFRSPEDLSVGFSAVVAKNPSGLNVLQVFPGSPAHVAGLIPGDELLKWGEQDVSNLPVEQIEQVWNGDQKVQVAVERKDAALLVRELQPKPAASFGGRDLDATFGGPLFLREVRQEVRGADEHCLVGLGVLFDSYSGEAVVTHIDFPSPAFDSGILIGDNIVEIAGIAIRDMDEDEVQALIAPTGTSCQTLAIRVQRKGAANEFTIQPQSYLKALHGIGRKMTRNGPAPSSCPD